MNKNNYCAISLTSTLKKIFFKLIYNMIEPTLTNNQPLEQAGFLATFSTQDHSQVVNQLEKRSEYQIKLYLVFLGFKKAFESLENVFLCTSLNDWNIPTGIIDLLKTLHMKNTAKVLILAHISNYSEKWNKETLSPLYFLMQPLKKYFESYTGIHMV